MLGRWQVLPGILKENSEPNIDEEGDDGDGDVVRGDGDGEYW